MNQNYQARLLFPSIFHEYTFEESDFSKDELIDFCYSQKKLNPKGLRRSNNGGWHSPIFNIEDENPISIHLRKGLSQSVFTTLEKHLSVKVTFWIMINSPNTHNDAHTHPNAHLSGVFWIKVPEKSGNTKFVNPSVFQSYIEINSYIDQFTLDTNVHEAYFYEPKEGKMVTFPSHVLHEVRRNESEDDRIAVSYNITLAGCLSDDE